MEEPLSPSSTDDESEWRSLRTQFLAAVNNNAAPEQRWALLVNDPWHQKELRRCVQRIVRRDRRLTAWADDIAQDALLILFRKLERTPDLRFDGERDADSFPGWLGVITMNNCRMAARRVARQLRGTAELKADALSEGGQLQLQLELWLDAREAMERLSEPDRTAIEFYLQGASAVEIAHVLDRSVPTSYRIVSRALKTLRRSLPHDGVSEIDR